MSFITCTHACSAVIMGIPKNTHKLIIFSPRYKGKLQDAGNFGAKKGAVIGFSLGLQYVLIFITYSASVW